MNDDKMYVILNMTRTVYGPRANNTNPEEPEAYLVMPGEEPHVYISFEEAVEGAAYLADEHGHTPETARIFELKPVPLTPELETLFKEKLEEIEND